MTQLQQAWPHAWQAILTANNQHPPMILRVNQRFLSRAAYLEKLQQANIAATEHPVVESAIELTQPVAVTLLPGFKEGWVSVQDAASQLAATVLDLAPHQRVLDACAAPGGKTGHILETEPDLAELVAVDIDAERLNKVNDNLQRLRLKATLCVGNAQQPTDWWDGQLFDRILCDAPCSATGVIRRHPDIKYLRQEKDFTTLQQQQCQMLQALWLLLKVGGKLVYSTCSIFPQENAEVITTFLRDEPTACECLIEASWGHAQTHGRQLLSGEHNMDGFYYAVLEKIDGKMA
jgi:16S rRNA (cytosine967-C5)-methyltransferase